MNSVCLKTLSRKYDMVPASWNDMTTAENTAVIFSQVSVNLMSSHSCTPKSILFYKDSWGNLMQWGEKAGRRKGKKGDKSAMILAGSAIAAGDATYLDF